MLKRTYIHFGSYGLTYNESQQYNTYQFNSGPNTQYNSYNIDFKLPTPLLNVKSVYLNTLELPVAFPNVRANSHLNTIVLSANSNLSNPFTISLVDKNYTDINTLLVDLNNSAVSLYQGVNIYFSLSQTGYVKITSTSSAFTSLIYIKPTNLSYLLGFRPTCDIQISDTKLSQCIYQLNLDNYFNMYISNLNTTRNNANLKNCSFKVLLNAINGVVLYTSENNTFVQSIAITPNTIIDKISVCIYDRFGYSLNSYGADWSFTLGFII